MKTTKYEVDYVERSKDDPEYLPIDFAVRLDEEAIAWVWGKSADDVEIECDHEAEFGDDDEAGVCPICGAECIWHYETEWEDTGHDDDGHCTGYEIRTRKVDSWSIPLVHKSIIKEVLEGYNHDKEM